MVPNQKTPKIWVGDFRGDSVGELKHPELEGNRNSWECSLRFIGIE